MIGYNFTRFLESAKVMTRAPGYLYENCRAREGDGGSGVGEGGKVWRSHSAKSGVCCGGGGVGVVAYGGVVRDAMVQSRRCRRQCASGRK